MNGESTSMVWPTLGSRTAKNMSSSVAIGAFAPPPTPVWPGHGNCRNPRRKKLEVGWGYRIILAKLITLKYVF